MRRASVAILAGVLTLSACSAREPIEDPQNVSAFCDAWEEFGSESGPNLWRSVLRTAPEEVDIEVGVLVGSEQVDAGPAAPQARQAVDAWVSENCG